MVNSKTKLSFGTRDVRKVTYFVVTQLHKEDT